MYNNNPELFCVCVSVVRSLLPPFIEKKNHTEKLILNSDCEMYVRNKYLVVNAVENIFKRLE